jgi:hypothetical protein
VAPLRELTPFLLDEENVLAGISCFRGLTLRTGLLLVTNHRLVWTKQSFLRRHPVIVAIPYADLRELRFYLDEDMHRPAPHPVRGGKGSDSTTEIFSFVGRRYDALPSVVSVLGEVPGERLILRLDPAISRDLSPTNRVRVHG